MAGKESRGRRLFAAPCRFLRSAFSEADLPSGGLPEVAFAGRSNVGKSSLINALTGRHGLARTSRTPGRTQALNFFEVGGRLVLVDLPGYGYARVSRAKARTFSDFARAYLEGRPELRRVLLLVDARLGLGPSDRALMTTLDEAAVVYQLVLTKADGSPEGSLERLTATLARELSGHPAAHPEVTATSARRSAGLERLRAELARLASR